MLNGNSEWSLDGKKQQKHITCKLDKCFIAFIICSFARELLMQNSRKEILQKSRYPSQWEELFEFWSQPPSKTEQDRCERTVREMKEAIRFDPRLSSKNVSVFAQGSYANRVNVRQDSDVDVCVCLDDICLVEYPPGLVDADVGLSNAGYSYWEFKDEVEVALVERFERARVVRGNKAFDVHSPAYLVDADVPTTFAFRQYYRIGSIVDFHEGTALISEKEKIRVTNFPKQQMENGRKKNDATGRIYRQQVRTIKTMRYNMEKWGIASSAKVSSFGLECLSWNVPDVVYLSMNSRHERLLAACVWMHRVLKDSTQSQFLLEVNGIKKLFGSHNSATAADYQAFIEDLHHIITVQP